MRGGNGGVGFRYLFSVSNRVNGDHQENLITIYGTRYQRMIGEPASEIVGKRFDELDGSISRRIEGRNGLSQTFKTTGRQSHLWRLYRS